MKRAACALALSWLVMQSTARADERIGPAILLQQTTYLWGAPRVVSDGIGTLVVWGAGYGPYTVYAARIDAAGNVSGPFVVSATPEYKQQPEVATDGRTALVVWSDFSSERVSGVKAVRLDPAGAPLDSSPIVIDSRSLGKYGGMNNATVAFDGAMFRVLWMRSTGTNKVLTRRIALDSSAFGRARRVRARDMAQLPFEARVGCRGGGECLLTWLQTAGLDGVEGVRIQGDTIADRTVVRYLNDARDHRISSDGTDYLIVGTRFQFTECAQGFCPQDAVAGRVGGDGTPLEVDGFRVNNRPMTGLPFVADIGVGFDGASYLAAFLDVADPCGFNLYAARIAPSGVVLTTDVPGSILADSTTVTSAGVAGTRTEAVAVWEDPGPSFCGGPAGPQSVYAQRALSHPDTSGATLVEIGAVGARSVAEQQTLRLVLAASGLNPATTAFSAANLPPGAVFDTSAHLFQWKPNPDEASVYPGVHFEATDGVLTVSEDVTITVTEGSLALCGTVERMNMPVANVAVQIKGGLAAKRFVYSNANGRFCFYHLIQTPYTLSVGRPSKKQYDAAPLHIIMGGSDVTDAHFVVRQIS
jgi:hypothetical protein